MPKITITLTDTPTGDDPNKVTIHCESEEPMNPEALSPAQRLAAFMLQSPSIMQQMQEADEAGDNKDSANMLPDYLPN